MTLVKRKNSGLIRQQIELNPKQAEEEGIEHQIELDFQISYLKSIKLCRSASSFYFSEVDSFTIGPFTSRFWAMRKHINYLSQLELRNSAPFHAWNCITIHRQDHLADIYLLIENEDVMTKFLLFLIHTLETIDGNRGSAKDLIK